MSDAATSEVAGAEIAADYERRVASLSAREREVLVLTAKGLGWKDISRRIGLTRNTVQNYRRDLYRKLDVDSACEAAVIAAKAGLV